MRIFATASVYTAVFLLLSSVAASQTRVYLTEEQALERTLHKPSYKGERRVSIAEDEVSRFEEQLGIDIVGLDYVFHEAEGEDGVFRRAVIVNVIGEYQPITFVVALLSDGTVSSVEILVYRESRGSEIRRRAFLKQFEKKTLDDPLTVHGDIMNITGATRSSRAVTGGVRLAMMLHEKLDEEEG